MATLGFFLAELLFIENLQKIFKSNNGQAFIFNDKLMHGGAAGGKFTRVNLEFTMLVKNKYLNNEL